MKAPSDISLELLLMHLANSALGYALYLAHDDEYKKGMPPRMPELLVDDLKRCIAEAGFALIDGPRGPRDS